MTAASRQDIDARRAAVGEDARLSVTIAIVEATGPSDRVAERDGAASVATIEIRTENLAPAFSAMPDADQYRIFIRLGEDLTQPEIEAALTALAASDVLAGGFTDVVEAGRHRAEVRRDTVQQVRQRAAEILTASLAEAAEVEDGAALAPGWVRYRTHERTGMPWRLGTRLWPAGDLPGLARSLESHALIALAWDPADPARAVVSRPDEYVRALAASGERPPLDRPAVVCAAWTAGCRNVRALAEAVGATRQTVYGDLDAAGLSR